MNHPVGDHDFGDRGDLLSCDSIESPRPVMIPARTIASTKGPSDNPIPLHSMNLHHMRDRQLSVAPRFRPDMRDAVRPSPLILVCLTTHVPHSDCQEHIVSRPHLMKLQRHSSGTSNNTILEITTSTSRGTTQMMSEETHHRQLIIRAVSVCQSILALNRHNQRIAQSLVQRDDDVPDLLVLQSSSLMSTKAMEPFISPTFPLYL